MPRKCIDLTGQRFSRLRVISRATEVPANCGPYWNVVCDCGTRKHIRGSQLTSGGTKSCGCYARDNPRNLKHGMTDSFEFRAWTAMRKRCSYPSHKAFAQYGGRGIKVCAQWKDFRNFYADMGACPFDRGSIERKDIDGDYEPDNCIWLPKALQSANRRVVLKSRERQSMMRREIDGLYELIGSLYIQLSGMSGHASDCAVHRAPAQLPGPCDCTGRK